VEKSTNGAVTKNSGKLLAFETEKLELKTKYLEEFKFLTQD
jgi:hypothetical protein|tara:strand:+ start:411 stop:533 length:123 start_codon:yes stop_codon:yes gene_type:complete